MTAALSIKSISKRFVNIHALDEVSFDVEKGEICAVMGENGAGKSTLMNILSGTFEQTSGSFYVDGKEARFRSPHEAMKAGIAIVHQELNLVETLTVLENLFVGRIPLRHGIVDWSAMARDARAILDRVGGHAIAPRKLVGELSIGQQQLVEIARVLSVDPAILILDEPTSSLSEDDSLRLLELVRELKRRGHTILYISHRMHEVLEIADSVVVLRDGRFVTKIPAAEATEGGIAEAMVGRVVDQLDRTAGVADGPCVLELRGVTTAEGIADISFKVHAGEIVGIGGLMGAGRSETARAIGGDTPLTAGTILVDGREHVWRDPADAMRAGVCMVPEDRKAEGLNLIASIEENMILPYRHTVSRQPLIQERSERSIVRRFFERMAINAPGIEAIVSQLSGGNQQKVVLGKMFAVGPKVMIFDEPTRGVDVAAKAEIHRIIVEAADAGAAIVFISSELPELLAISDRVLVMASGRMVGELPRGASETDVMIRAFSKTGGQSLGNLEVN